MILAGSLNKSDNYSHQSLKLPNIKSASEFYEWLMMESETFYDKGKGLGDNVHSVTESCSQNAFFV